jgi:hypothetical protein
MISNKVKDKYSLKKRVDRFFNTPPKFRGEVSSVVMSLTKESTKNIYAFGGLVRDISLFGITNFSSDVDLVFGGSKTELERALKSLNPIHLSENKFGGFRLRMKSWDIDIWSAADTWAFRESLVTYSSIESLLETTLMSWDSVIYNINDRKLIYRENYLDDILKGRLDIVLEKNPNEIGAMVRLGRTIHSKNVLSLSPKAANLIKYYLSTFSFDDIIQYEINSYNNQYLTTKNLNSLYNKINSNDIYKDVILDLKQLKLNLI